MPTTTVAAEPPPCETDYFLKIFLIYVRDQDYFRLLPPELAGSRFAKGRVQVMAFPPIGIETLAPVVRQHGHQVKMFDTCHPEMREPHIAAALRAADRAGRPPRRG